MENIKTPRRDLLNELGLEESIVFENPDYDEAITGVSSDGNVIYDYDLMVECLRREGMSFEEAIDWIDYNTIRALPYIGEGAPIIMYRIEG
jgi:hypothetical protein